MPLVLREVVCQGPSTATWLFGYPVELVRGFGKRDGWLVERSGLGGEWLQVFGFLWTGIFASMQIGLWGDSFYVS